jgi:hypothetical protein
MLNVEQQKRKRSEAMKVLIVSVIFASLLLGACQADHKLKAYEPTPLDETDEEACSDLPGAGKPPGTRTITISYRDKSVDGVEPKRSCARPGDLLKFVLTGPPETLVRVKGNSTGSDWIRGGGNTRFFYVVVPHDIIRKGDKVGRLFSYDVAVGEAGMDPEVRVRHQ